MSLIDDIVDCCDYFKAGKCVWNRKFNLDSNQRNAFNWSKIVCINVLTKPVISELVL